MLTQWLKPARGCKLVLLSLVTNLIDCILPFTYCLLPIAYCLLHSDLLHHDNKVFFAQVNRSHNCHNFCNITLMKSMTKVLTVNSTAWLYRLSILDGCISKLGNVCTARFLFLAIMFLFSKSVSYFFMWLCICAIVNFLFITFQYSLAGGCILGDCTLKQRSLFGRFVLPPKTSSANSAPRQMPK